MASVALTLRHLADTLSALGRKAEAEQLAARASAIQRRTAMPVCRIEDGMRIEPDHVYVIPPNRDALMNTLRGTPGTDYRLDA